MSCKGMKHGWVGASLTKPQDAWSAACNSALQRREGQWVKLEWSLSLFCNQVSKFDRVLWSWAISNWCRTSLARPNWVFTCPTFFWLQLWSALIVALNLFARVSKGQEVAWTEDQAVSTACWKWALAGCTSFSPKRSGQWSEPSLALLCKRQFGKSCSYSEEQNTLSSLTSVGVSCWLDQVYFLPCNDNSFSSNSLISRRNLPIIALLRFPLLLSSALVIRLQSPSTVHGPRQADLNSSQFLEEENFIVITLRPIQTSQPPGLEGARRELQGDTVVVNPTRSHRTEALPPCHHNSPTSTSSR
jgi:hypothetical protein